VTGREPDDLAAGNGEPGAVRVIRLCQVVPGSGVIPVRGSAAGCVHPFACPRPRGRGAWGGSASKSRNSTWHRYYHVPRRTRLY
jgi:hypothetical protein